MHEIDFLRDLVIILGAAVVVVALLRRVGVPPIAGFIVTGLLAGPTALGLVDDTHEVEVLAEIGVVLLLFGIGLELSLERLKRLWRAVVLGGGLQVTLTVLLGSAIAHGFGVSFGASIFTGCIVAVSSTAVVLRGLSARGELDAPHGRLAVGILVFQDLCVVPMILAVPFLAGDRGSWGEVLATMGLAGLILVAVVVAGSLLVPRLLAFVAQTRERDLFVLAVFLLCLGIAWGVSLVGISLSLGAFLAGLVVAGSEFRHQALSDLIPTREVFASLFFVSVGMLLDVSDVVAHAFPILGLLAALLVGKFAIVLATALVLRLPLRVAVLSAAALCQVGEFSFVLLGSPAAAGLLDEALAHNLLVAIILSMLLTPLGLAFGPALATNAARIPWLNRLLDAQPPGVEGDSPRRGHVIVAGYGLAGERVCDALREEGTAYVVVDVNPDNVRRAKRAGHQAVLGDVTRSEVLEDLGVDHAKLVVVNINDPRATELAVLKIREAAPKAVLVVRTQFEMDKSSLEAAGASQVITSEATASAAVVAATLGALSPAGASSA